jgi:hypothetical protein
MVQDVVDVNVYSVNVLEREETTFTCEIEFEAGLVLRLEVEQEEKFGYEYEDYEPSRLYRTTKSIHRNFGAEIVVRFDPQKPDATELESVHVFKDNVELDIDDLRGR